jgi:hypothetical protein
VQALSHKEAAVVAPAVTMNLRLVNLVILLPYLVVTSWFQYLEKLLEKAPKTADRISLEFTGYRLTINCMLFE